MRPARSAQPAPRGLFATAGVAAIALLLVFQLPPMAGPRAALRGGLAPLEAAATGLEARAGSALGVFGDIGLLRARNAQLEDQNAALRAQVAALQAAGSENADLRRDLAFVREFGHATVSAQVIARGSDEFSRTLTIDRGSSAGVRPGMVVLTGAGLVGRVAAVASSSAEVQTVADPLVRVNAYLPASGFEGTVSGGAGPLRMEVLPRQDGTPRPGDWALTSGVGGGYPRGIPVGQVTRFDRHDAAVASVAELAWANDISRLSAVIVVTDFVPR